MGRFKEGSSVRQAWLFALVFVDEAVLVTGDALWVECLAFMMAELSDVM